MKLGDLVKLKSPAFHNIGLVGLIVRIPAYNLVVEVLWADGLQGQVARSQLEVFSAEE